MPHRRLPHRRARVRRGGGGRRVAQQLLPARLGPHPDRPLHEAAGTGREGRPLARPPPAPRALQRRPLGDLVGVLTGMRYPPTFASLEHRNFRLFWLGQLVSLVGTWLQQVALSWYVLALTDSAFLLGAVSAIGSLPVLLLSLPGGVVADRVPKRGLLIVTQGVAMLMAFLLAALVHFQVVRLWHIVAIAAVSGSAFAFDAPARQSYQAELVPREKLLNAIALNSAIFNGARIMGPALAGLLYAAIGPAGCFLLNGASFLAVIGSLWLITARSAPPRRELSAWDDMRTGVTYVWRAPAVRGFITIVAVFSVFGMAYAVLMPVFARDVLHVGARGFGFLMTATGAGALAGALGLATFGRMKRRGEFVFAAGLLFAAAATALAPLVSPTTSTGV
ncbi:MFS transporter, partial [bacterium]|nr:MFS transporter [bacterium]